MQSSSRDLAIDNAKLLVYECFLECADKLGYKLLDDAWSADILFIACQLITMSSDFDYYRSGELTPECTAFVKRVASAVANNNIKRRAYRKWDRQRTFELNEDLCGHAPGDPEAEVAWQSQARDVARRLMRRGVPQDTAIAMVLCKSGMRRRAVCAWLREHYGVELRENTLTKRLVRITPIWEELRPELQG